METNFILVIIATTLGSILFSTLMIEYVAFPFSFILSMIGGFAIGITMSKLFLR